MSILEVLKDCQGKKKTEKKNVFTKLPVVVKVAFVGQQDNWQQGVTGNATKECQHVAGSSEGFSFGDAVDEHDGLGPMQKAMIPKLVTHGRV